MYQDKILTADARVFLDSLHHQFEGRRRALLEARQTRQAQLDQGWLPTLEESSTNWNVTSIPHDLQKRWVEITGPTERKMMINALNSGADVFMADFEDALSPTWNNVLDGQNNLREAVRRTLVLETSEKKYALNSQIATLVVRPRGWHLEEKHYLVDGQAISGSLFDFGLYFFHNSQPLIEIGSGPYFYLPKLENREEAQLWNDVFVYAESWLNLSPQSIKATVLIETILAAFEMETILCALKDYVVGLNAGRWDYIFSIIKKFAFQKDLLLPDRSQIAMTEPFMRAYTSLLVQTCHKHGAYAIGGMSAFIPNRKDAAVTAQALEQVTSDKLREIEEGFDGTWVAHPDLVPVARKVFETQSLHEEKKEKVTAHDLLNFTIPNARISLAGVTQNVSVAFRYLEAWFRGLGAVAIQNLMEDMATAEISRSELWQWIHHGASISEDQQKITLDLVKKLLYKEKEEMQSTPSAQKALRLLEQVLEREVFTEFLTLEAYQLLNNET